MGVNSAGHDVLRSGHRILFGVGLFAGTLAGCGSCAEPLRARLPEPVRAGPPEPVRTGGTSVASAAAGLLPPRIGAALPTVRRPVPHPRSSTASVSLPTQPPVPAARAKPAPKAPRPAAGPSDPTAAFLTLVVDGVGQGESPVYLEPHDALIPVAVLGAAGVTVDPDAVRTVDGTPYVSLSAASLPWTVDERDLSIAVTVDPARLPGRTVRVGGRGAPAGIEYSRDSSGFFNYGLRLVDLARVEGFAELGATVREARAYTGVTWLSGQGPVRGASNVTFDNRLHRRRFVVGDALASGGALGGAAWLGGVQLLHTSSLDPYHVPGPTLDQATTVLAPSTLEVYVNGQLTHRQEVAPGPLTVTDIPATAGAGDTRVVLRDALGREQVLTAAYYQPSGALAPGEQEYGYSLGFQREGMGTESWSYGPPAALGTHRVGLTPHLTAGARAELALDRVSGGLGAVGSSRFGQLEVSAAGSTGVDGPGAAGAFAWSYQSRPASASWWARAMSAHYVTLALDSADDRSLVETGVSVSKPLSTRASLSASYAVAVARDSGVAQSASLGAGLRLPWDLQLSAYGTWTGRPDAETFGAWLGVTRGFGKRATGTVRAEADDAGASGVAEVQQSLPTGAGLGYRVGGRAGATDEASAQVAGQASFGRADASLDWRPDHVGDELGVAGGLVAIGGRVFATRPVDASYALVRVPGVPGVHASLDNNLVGRTDARGDLVVTGLLPNYGNRLGIVDADVPLDQSVSAVERVIAPPVRGGAVVEFPVQRARLVRGRIGIAGADATYGEVDVAVGADHVVSPVGRDGAFELADLPAGRWVSTVRYAGGTCAALLDVPLADTPVTDLGTCSCIPTEAP
jgi:outer membrane usher protein